MKQIFKLIWNNKSRNAILILELLGTFLLVFGLYSICTMFYMNFKEPIGFTYDDVWMIDASSPEDKQIDQKILKTLPEYKEIEKATMMEGNTPFMFRYWRQIPRYKDVKKPVITFDAEDDFRDIMSLNVVEGRWYGSEDNASKLRPAVINQAFQKDFFKGENPIGKELELTERDNVIIVGVIDNFKYGGELTFTEPQLFIRTLYREPLDLPYDVRQRPSVWDNNMQGTAGDPIFIKLKKGIGKEFEQQLVTSITQEFPGTNVIVKSLPEMRESNMGTRLIPTAVLLVIVVFLVINIFIGLFGVLWYNISTRSAEIGLRRAIGANTLEIYKQFITEMLMVGLLGMIPGLLIAIQFPLLNAFDLDGQVYYVAMALAFATVSVLIVVCAYLPSRQAALVDPAIALRQE
ncbi:ABC transporter permease [Reichenbachiella versicolor]|uniref:ABC transporter permease n=1 Tax=Reichenbachiella versicolor TaxID=1821036 RepID=UPI000D6E556B|nr:FtsX-like permease family protein [Reichenbachiella versicolor]